MMSKKLDIGWWAAAKIQGTLVRAEANPEARQIVMHP